MACNCTKCHPSECCGNGALSNPCTYTECNPPAERCEESVSMACVVWNGPTTEVEDDKGETFVISEGERLESILQRMMRLIGATTSQALNGLTDCTSSNKFHAPNNIYFGTITANTIQILWAGEDPGTATIDILMDTAVNPTGWVSQGTVGAGVFSFTIPNLTPQTGYRFKLEATANGGEICDSEIWVYKSTL
tara:strand:+ start:543 stop:1121 length:579 start_codon:yes stop_codon:yes gene_type:complete